MDLFDKFQPLIGLRGSLVSDDADPFGVRMDEVLSASEATIDGRRTILAGTNNYLGLTFDPGAIDAAVDALRQEGTGTTGSRIANGTYAGHQALEADIARFLGRRAAIVFTTGYQANLGTLAGLAGPKDTILIDADSHASIYDGCKLSGAEIIRFRHNDPADLDRRLGRLDPAASNKLVVVEGVYSMFGDRAPLAEFAEVKARHNAYLVVDEAHSFGVFGDAGRGVAEADGIEDKTDFVVGTFSKSLGATGGFLASDHAVLDILRVASRPYMYTASLTPSVAASVGATLRRIAAEPGLRTTLWRNIDRLHGRLSEAGLSLCAGKGPILAVRTPGPAEAYAMWRRLLEAGIYVNLAIPPGTPGGVSLLRCSVSAAHTPEQIERIADALIGVAGSANQAPAAQAARFG